MPYNLSENAVTRWKEQLDMLDGTVREFRSNSPHKLAYRLREAIAAARHNHVEPYDKIDYAFTVRNDIVVARPREQVVVEALRVTIRAEAAVSEYDVVRHASKSREDVLEYPNFDGDLKSVKLWCSTNEFEVTEEPYLILERTHDHDQGSGEDATASG